MLYVQNFDYDFWIEVVVNVVCTRNICRTSALASMIRQEAWSERQPYISCMRTFGCIAYAKTLDCMRSKLDAKGTKYVFLGYCKGTKT